MTTSDTHRGAVDASGLIDVNVSFGTWPFQSFAQKSLSELASHLNGQGIEHAFVSHLGGVFNPDAGPFNLELIHNAEDLPGIHAVPVINPVFPGWDKQLDRCRALAGIKAIKIYPTFHNYRLTDVEFVAPLAEYVRKNNLTVLVAMRLEDERTRYFALNVLGLPVDDVVAFHEEYPELSTICLNAYLPEARRIGDETAGLGVDTSFAEWFLAIEELLNSISPERVFFGSHTPFLYTKANVLKLMQSRISDARKQEIGSANARRLLGL